MLKKIKNFWAILKANWNYKEEDLLNKKSKNYKIRHSINQNKAKKMNNNSNLFYRNEIENKIFRDDENEA